MKLFKSLSFLTLFFTLLTQGLPAISEEPQKKEILVEWSNTNSFSQRAPILKQIGGSRVKGFQTHLMKRKGRGVIEVISLPDGSSVNSAIETLRKTPGVVTAEPNIRYQTTEVSNDPMYLNGSLWGMYSDDSVSVGPSGTTNQFGSQAEQAWNTGHIGNTKVVVGVIDTGVDYTHPDLYLNIYLNQGEIRPLTFFNSMTDVDGDSVITFRDLNNPANSSFVTDFNGNGRIDGGDLLNDARWENGVDNDSNGYVDDLVGWDFYNNDNDPMDDNFHGTHVAGTIGAIGGNGVGVVGVNWKLQIMPLKFLGAGGSGYLSDAIASIDYYTAETLNKDVSLNPNYSSIFLGTNNSWGGGGYSSLLLNSIVAGANANNHFIAAAGNSSTNNNSSPFYPSNYSTLSAAGWEAVTAVASLSSNGSLSSFSNYGSTTVDIGAPGADILSTFPSNSYQSISGTSMATPHVAGAMASFLSSYPNADRRSLRDVLLTTAIPTSSLNGKVVTNGRIDMVAGVTEMESRNSGNPTPTYSLGGPTSVNEGASVSLTVTTSNVNNGTVLYWSLSGISEGDTSVNSLFGSLTINFNSGSVSFLINNDNLLEGVETLTFRLFSNSGRTHQVATKTVEILDTSTGYTYIWGTTSNNNIIGSANPDFISGVPSTGVTTAALGRGQIDSVTGKGGADIFTLGQMREGSIRIFYNNGVSGSVGSNDYLLIKDFNRLVDKIQLPSGRYFIRNTSTNTTMYWDRNGNGVLNLTGTNRDELIAIIQRVNLGNMTITENSKPAWVRYSN